jgi:hypothetical protein
LFSFVQVVSALSEVSILSQLSTHGLKLHFSERLAFPGQPSVTGQVLKKLAVPPPQVLLQDPDDLHADHCGQACVLQDSVFSFTPGQLSPLHVLVKVISPPPQLVLHSPDGVQSFHSLWTDEESQNRKSAPPNHSHFPLKQKHSLSTEASPDAIGIIGSTGDIAVIVLPP